MFRNGPNRDYIRQTFLPSVKPAMQRIRIKLLRQEEEKASKANAIDFLNLVFGTGPEFEPFWAIVGDKVKKKYDVEMKDPQDYAHGHLLKTVLYHCGIKVTIHGKLKLFRIEKPFTEDDKVEFLTKSKIYDFPSMSLHRIADTSAIPPDQTERKLSRLELQLQISEALHSPRSEIIP